MERLGRDKLNLHKPQTVVERLFFDLASKGVKYVFGVPGDDPYVQKAIEDYSTGVTMRDERSAAFAAQVAGRLTGLGVCTTSHGPGITNAVTGLAAARLERDPLLLVCSQLSRQNAREGHHGYVPSRALSSWAKKLVDCGKHEVSGVDVDSLLSIMNKPFRGPAVVILPDDISCVNIKGEMHIETTTGMDIESTINIVKNEQIIGDIVGLLESSHKRVAVVGAGVIRSHAIDSVKLFLKEFSITATTTYHAKGVLGEAGDFALCKHIKNWNDIPDVDLWILIGVDMTEGLPPFWRNGKAKGRVIQVVEKIEYRGLTHTLSGNIHESLQTLCNYGHRRMTRHRDVLTLHRKPTNHPVEVLAAESKHFEGRITVDTGLFKHAWGVWGIASKCLQILFTNGLSIMGWSIGAAIGAALSTGEPCLAVIGDGGFSNAMAELFTISQYNLPVSILIINDHRFGMIYRIQMQKLRDSYGVSLKGPRYKSIADSFGMRYLKMSDLPLKKWQDAFRFASSNPSLLEFEVDYSDFMKLD